MPVHPQDLTSSGAVPVGVVAVSIRQINQPVFERHSGPLVVPSSRPQQQEDGKKQRRR